uniref:tRNA methyltransferase 10 homolog C n=1 Tax=Ciona intestinalis TaxID=7719 RepID=UPI000180D00E|nr:tRNA methyltransferase 10 homolog C [Ciona intestinalis]|eukprot:XP_026689682.1 tRNA methyltransferase 10 homolog C [Ciona intestinalis]
MLAKLVSRAFLQRVLPRTSVNRTAIKLPADLFENENGLQAEPIDNKFAGEPESYMDFEEKARELMKPERVKESSYIKELAKHLNKPNKQLDGSFHFSGISSIADQQELNGELVKMYNKDISSLWLDKEDSHTPDDLELKLAYQYALQLVIPGRFDFPTKQDYDNCKDDLKICVKSLNESKNFLNAIKKLMKHWSHSRLKVFNKSEQKNQSEDTVKVKHTSPKNTLLTFYSPSLMMRFNKRRLITAQQHGQPMIVDMDFETYSNVGDMYKQLSKVIADNRRLCHPFNVIMANHRKDNELSAWSKTDFFRNNDNSAYLNVTEKSYLDMQPLINPESLIYLTPDASEYMTEFQHDKVYIWAGLVDKIPQAGLTKTKAHSEKIKCERFPLELYLKWGGIGARKNLCLTDVFNILVTLRDTDNDWVKAFSALSNRFHRGLTELGKWAVDYDEKIILDFESGKRKLEEKERNNKFTKVYKTKPYFGQSGFASKFS